MWGLLAPPLTLAALITAFLIPNWGGFYRALVYACVVPVHWSIKGRYEDYMNTKEAARMGAVLAPQVKGKWPGGIDLIFKYVRFLVLLGCRPPPSKDLPSADAHLLHSDAG